MKEPLSEETVAVEFLLSNQMKSLKFPGIKHSVGKHIQSYEGSHVELSQSAIHWQPTSLSSTSISYMNVFRTLRVFSICDKKNLSMKSEWRQGWRWVKTMGLH